MDGEIRAELERIHDEDDRQNKRLDILEASAAAQQSIAMSVQKLAINMEHMIEEQKNQGSRLDKIESQPAEAWSSMKKTIINTVIGIVVGAIGSAAIYGLFQYFTITGGL